MGFERPRVDVTCDVCGLETEPVDLGSLANGGYSIDSAVAELRRDGWAVNDATLEITCADCLAEMEDQP